MDSRTSVLGLVYWRAVNRDEDTCITRVLRGPRPCLPTKPLIGKAGIHVSEKR
jgi:hypothetical protein